MEWKIITNEGGAHSGVFHYSKSTCPRDNSNTEPSNMQLNTPGPQNPPVCPAPQHTLEKNTDTELWFWNITCIYYIYITIKLFIYIYIFFSIQWKKQWIETTRISECLSIWILHVFKVFSKGPHCIWESIRL